jgi:aspartate 1-decarboxylase
MLRTWLVAKLHGITVTSASVEYTGSVSIDARLMAQAGVGYGEQVHVVNLNTGGRWVTYALPGEPGEFALNGGGARLGQPGDRCVVMVFGLDEEAPGAVVLFCGPDNQVSETMVYPAAPSRPQLRA